MPVSAPALGVLRLFIAFLQQVLEYLESQPPAYAEGNPPDERPDTPAHTTTGHISVYQETPSPPAHTHDEITQDLLGNPRCTHCNRPPYDDDTGRCLFHLRRYERISRNLSTCAHLWHRSATPSEPTCPRCRNTHQ